MPGFGPNAFSVVDNSPAPPVFGNCYKDPSTTNVTSLVTDDFVVVSALTVLPDVSAQSGLSHIGNFQFQNDEAEDKTVNMLWTGAASSTALIANQSVDFAIGIWDGAVFVPQLDDLYPFLLQSTGVQAQDARGKVSKVFNARVIPAGSRSAIMCRRNGSGPSLRIYNGQLAIYEVTA